MMLFLGAATSVIFSENPSYSSTATITRIHKCNRIVSITIEGGGEVEVE